MAFFNRNRELLEKEPYLATLEVALLNHGNLKNYLEQDPHFIHVLGQFINENREKAILRADIKAELFFLRMTSCCQKYGMRYAPQEKIAYVDRIQQLQQLYKKCEDDSLKNLIVLHLVEAISELPLQQLQEEPALITALLQARCFQWMYEAEDHQDIIWKYEREKNYSAKIGAVF